jgi:hypothetical protein
MVSLFFILAWHRPWMYSSTDERTVHHVDATRDGFALTILSGGVSAGDADRIALRCHFHDG